MLTCSCCLPPPQALHCAAILAASTVLLTVETSAYTITPNQIPALILALSLAILTIYTWSYAAVYLHPCIFYHIGTKEHRLDNFL